MTDLDDFAQAVSQVPVLARIHAADFDNLTTARLDLPFTKSRGTIMSRLYERLTKASRRRQATQAEEVYDHNWGIYQNQLNHALQLHSELAYRQGAYDAYTALQDEMA